VRPLPLQAQGHTGALQVAQQSVRGARKHSPLVAVLCTPCCHLRAWALRLQSSVQPQQQTDAPKCRLALQPDVSFWNVQVFSERAMDFQERIMDKSGLGDETYLPPGEV